MLFRHPLPTILVSLLGMTLIGCGESTVSSVWVASEPQSGKPLSELSEDLFYDHPWPSDLRLDNGKVKLTNFPNPRGSIHVDSYISLMDGVLDGFSPAAAGYVRFSGPIDASLLPIPADTVSDESVVQLIDVDPKSPEFRQRRLVSLRYQELKGAYYQPSTLAFMPAPGFPLRPHTRYAFVVTDSLMGFDGKPIAKSPDLAQVLGDDPLTDPNLQSARTKLEPDLAELEGLGIDRDDIVHLAVFTTNDPTEELFAFRDHLRANVPAPKVNSKSWRLIATSDVSAEYVGVYGPSPNYQAGKIPFSIPDDGGNFNYVDGQPAVVDTFDLRFSLTIPTKDECKMPAEGYPIVLYAHGTGGDFRSYYWDGTAGSLARKCIATMGVDQIFHGKRPGAPEPDQDTAIALRFFNLDNVMAARTSNRQSALDEVQRARLFTETKITIPANVSVWDQEIRFDPKRVMFFGHSQGGLNGPLFLAADDQALGGVLSGSGALMSITLIEKTEPTPSVAQIVREVLLDLEPEEFTELDIHHPIMSFAQMLVDTTDPINYARSIIREPRAGMNPKNIYMTVGVDSTGHGDSYAPPRGIEMHAVAMGLPLIGDTAQREIPEVAWPGGPRVLHLSDFPGPVTNNLARGRATGALAQWAPADGRDGHFVVFDVAGAREQADLFVQSLGREGIAKLVNTQSQDAQ